MQHIIERLKHLPGKHNQSSHGRKRGGSSGGSTIDLSVDARKKPVATEGQMDMFSSIPFDNPTPTVDDASSNKIQVTYDPPSEDAPSAIKYEHLMPGGVLFNESVKFGIRDYMQREQRTIDFIEEQILQATGQSYTGEKYTMDHLSWMRSIYDSDDKSQMALSFFPKELFSEESKRGEYDFAFARKGYSTTDFQALIYDIRGYNKLPTVVATVDDLRASDGMKRANGETQLYFRGVQSKVDIESGQTIISARQINDQLRSGEKHHVGFGIFGNGSYFATATDNDPKPDINAFTEAQNYAGGAVPVAEKRGDVVAMAFKPDAKIAYGASGMKQYYRDKMVEDIKSGKITTEQMEVNFNVLTHMNSGSLVALLGFDAYSATGSYMVLLNRSATIMANQSIRNTDL